MLNSYLHNIYIARYYVALLDSTPSHTVKHLQRRMRKINDLVFTDSKCNGHVPCPTERFVVCALVQV